MACTFCATGKLGLLRNLTVGEIVEQVMIAIHYLKKEGLQLRNVVFMGMGEPFLNYSEVKKSLDVFCGPKCLNFSERRVTISTCGIVPGIKKLMVDHPQISLAVSLHAPNDEARRSIMPVDNTYPLAELMKALDEYVEVTNKRIFYEYIMIKGVTDKLQYAYELADLMQDRLGHVNFIPYNAGEGIMGNDMQPTSSLMIKKFQRVLEERGVPSTVRFTMGDDIDAACGQLALKVDGKKTVEVQGKRIGG
jgi:23S rRNA (adenine2503-C2)-methyltransferase